MSEAVETSGLFLLLFSVFGFAFAVYVVIALAYSDTREEEEPARESMIATDRVIHCWEDHPDAPLECICSSGEKKAGEPCILNRH